jgi:hypothetical protein
MDPNDSVWRAKREQTQKHFIVPTGVLNKVKSKIIK